MDRAGRLSIAATLALGLVTFSAFPTPAAARAPIGSHSLSQSARALALVRTKMREQRIPGLQIVVVKRGRIVFNASLGLANLEANQPVNQTTRFPINSATKSFTGIAIMQLVEAGKVDLAAPIGSYLPDLPAAWRSIKVRQLLSHSSGLPNIVDGEGLIGTGGEEQAWAAVYTKPFDSPTGTAFAYNQTNYALLARIISQQSGMAFADFFQRRQFAPAGMRNTVMADSFDVVANRAEPYSYYRRARGKGEIEGPVLSHWIDDLPAFMRTGAGITTTATDLGNWLIALRGGRLLASPSLREQLWQADRFDNGEPVPWAMGWPVLQTEPRQIVGGLGGGRSAFFVYPKDDLAIVVLTNLVGGNPQRFMGEIAQIYLGD